MNINTLEMEWTDSGCLAKVEGFNGMMITCPRCQALLPRGEEHRCGDMLTAKTAGKARKALKGK